MEITSIAEYLKKSFLQSLHLLLYCGFTYIACGPWADSQWESFISPVLPAVSVEPNHAVCRLVALTT